MRIQLIELKKEHQDVLKDFVEEFKNHNESSIPGGSNIENMSFEEWVSRIERLSDKENIPDGFVASTLRLVFDNNRLVGIVDMRHDLNEGLLKSGGHIGYSVRPTERKKGYAIAMMQEVLKFYKELNIEKVLLCCLKDNIASKNTILHSGGKFENEIQEGNKTYLRFWIDVCTKI